MNKYILSFVLLLGTVIGVNAQVNTAYGTGWNFTVRGVTFVMKQVSGGVVMMGSPQEDPLAEPDELPQHQVTLSSYYIGETEVTQELWESVMGKNPARFKKGPDHPVERVTWLDCMEFIKRLNELSGQQFRLPTEAEWEFAALGGCESQHHLYAGSENLQQVGWYKENITEGGYPDETTHPVKSKQPNELGLYDMCGNVYEWCSDGFGFYTDEAQRDPQGKADATYHIIRGGAWESSPEYCRVKNRYMAYERRQRDRIGLRLALTQE